MSLTRNADVDDKSNDALMLMTELVNSRFLSMDRFSPTCINGLRTFFPSFGAVSRGVVGSVDFVVGGCVGFAGGVAGGEENAVVRSFSCSGANLGLGLRLFQVLYVPSLLR